MFAGSTLPASPHTLELVSDLIGTQAHVYRIEVIWVEYTSESDVRYLIGSYRPQSQIASRFSIFAL